MSQCCSAFHKNVVSKTHTSNLLNFKMMVVFATILPEKQLKFACVMTSTRGDRV